MAVLALCSLLSSGCRSSDQPASFADALLTDIKEFSHPVIARAGLTPAELRLISEWVDIGGQYYNDPFAVPVN